VAAAVIIRGPGGSSAANARASRLPRSPRLLTTLAATLAVRSSARPRWRRPFGRRGCAGNRAYPPRRRCDTTARIILGKLGESFGQHSSSTSRRRRRHHREAVAARRIPTAYTILYDATAFS